MSNPNSDQEPYMSGAPEPTDPTQRRRPLNARPRAVFHRPADQSVYDSVTWTDAISSIKLSDFTRVHQQPCIRDAWMPGIAGAAAIAAGRFVLGGSLFAACNWACGSFLGISTVMYQRCQAQRHRAREGVRAAVEVLEAKQKMQMEDDERRKRDEESSRNRDPKGKVDFWSTFKFW